MRKIFLIFLVFAGITRIEAQKNIIKIAPSVTNVGLQYERSLTKHFSVLGQIGRGFGYTGISTGGNRMRESGITYILEARYYFSSKRDNMEGWYVAPSVKRVTVDRMSYYSPSSDYYSYYQHDPLLYQNQSYVVVNEKKVNYNILCLNVGRQWVFNSKLTFGFSAGIGYQKEIYKDNSFSATTSAGYSSSGGAYASSSGDGTKLPIALQIGLSLGYAF